MDGVEQLFQPVCYVKTKSIQVKLKLMPIIVFINFPAGEIRQYESNDI
jgi:hypothetical protein